MFQKEDIQYINSTQGGFLYNGRVKSNVTPVTSKFDMADCVVKPQGDHTPAKEKLGHENVLNSFTN